MKAKHVVTLLLIGLFAVGVPVGVVADEGPVIDPWTWEIESPLGTGLVVSKDGPSDRSQGMDSDDWSRKVEKDPSWITDSSITGFEGE